MSDITRSYAKLSDLLKGLTGIVKVSQNSGLSMTQTQVTLTAATSTAVVAANPNRRYLAILNTGNGDANLAFGATAVVDTGWLLAASGGGMVWEGSGVPTNAINAISTAGSKLVVLEG